MRKQIMVLLGILLLASTAVASSPKKHRRIGRPCGEYTLHKPRKQVGGKHYRIGRNCGHGVRVITRKIRIGDQWVNRRTHAVVTVDGWIVPPSANFPIVRLKYANGTYGGKNLKYFVRDYRPV